MKDQISILHSVKIYNEQVLIYEESINLVELNISKYVV